MDQIRAGLPPLPARMASLPIDERGYPVPYFVAWVDGKPDHRIADSAKMPNAVRLGLCWMCGGALGRFKSFCIGPMCSITRTISEPPSHLECVTYAAQACPWMTRPHAKRRTIGLPDEIVEPAGHGLKRNPGAVCVWTTLRFRAERYDGQYLFEIGEPEHTEWFCEGRLATRAEVDESIRTGLPLVRAPAEEQDASNPSFGAVAELNRRIVRETAWLDRQAWPVVA